MSKTTYYTFKRSARNWQEYSSAEKETVDTGLSLDEAREACREFNDNRTSEEIDAGTKLEFTAED